MTSMISTMLGWCSCLITDISFWICSFSMTSYLKRLIATWRPLGSTANFTFEVAPSPRVFMTRYWLHLPPSGRVLYIVLSELKDTYQQAIVGGCPSALILWGAYNYICPTVI